MRTINIFIHGLGSSSETWKNLVRVLKITAQDRYGKNFTEYSNLNNRNLDYVENAYFAFFDYESKIISSDGFLSNYIKKIRGLKSDIDSLGIDDIVDLFDTYLNTISTNFDKINIFAHSLGGVVALRYFLTKDINIDKINSIVYLASPFLGSENSDDLLLIFRKKLFWQPMKPSRILKQLGTSSDFINSLSTDIENKCHKLSRIDSTFFYAQRDARINNPRDLIAKHMSFQVVPHDHKSVVEDAESCQIIYPLICDKIFSNVEDCNACKVEDDVSPKVDRLKEEIDNLMCRVKYQDGNTHYFDISHKKITQKLYNEVMNRSSGNKAINEPIDNISWFEAIEFCNTLSEKLNLEQVYVVEAMPNIAINENSNGYRLPKLKEMEYVLDNESNSIEDFKTNREWTNDKDGVDSVTIYNSLTRNGDERNTTSHNSRLGSVGLGFRILKKEQINNG